MGIDDIIGQQVAELLGILNTLREQVSNGAYTTETDDIQSTLAALSTAITNIMSGSDITDGLETAFAAFATTVNALVGDADRQDIIVLALGALTTTIDGIVAKPLTITDVDTAIDNYLTALDAILNPT